MKLNHWSEIRRSARENRKKALMASGGDSSPDALLSAVADLTRIRRIGVPKNDPMLYNSQAILHSGMVLYDKTLDEWCRNFNQMHEYAHHILGHGSSTFCCADDFNSEASEDSLNFGEQRIEGYGPHERRELEANLFAREFFLPCDVLRDDFLNGESDESIAAKFKMPPGMVVHQLMRAVLGIEVESAEPETTEKETNPDGIELDVDQERAAHFGLAEFSMGRFEPPVLVDAGPGTGKTRTLTSRIVHLINDRKIEADNILALTYSNKAAEEMYMRVSEASSKNASHIWMGTFHKFCLELIRKYHSYLEITARPLVADVYDVQLLLEQSLDRLNLKFYRSLARPSSNFQYILKIISRAKDELISPDDYRNSAQLNFDNSPNNRIKRERAERDLEIANAYRVYQDVLRENNLLDYGDLLFFAVELLRKHEAVRDEVQRKYRYILIDEYQDVNTASRELLKLIAGDGNGLWVVGDIRQAIYRFRGAAPANMLLLATEDYPTAEVLQLKTNHRAKEKIVKTFTTCGNRMKAQVDKSRVTEWKVSRPENDGEISYIEAKNELDEAQAIVEAIKKLNEEKTDYRHQAILCRQHEHLVEYSAVLEKAGIPVLYLGNFFERPEIRDLLCVIDLASGMDGRGLFRLAGFPEYDFPTGDAAELINQALGNGLRFPRALARSKDVKTLSKKGKASLGLISEHFKDCHPNSSSWTVLSRYLFSKSDYLRNLLKDENSQTMQRRLAIYQLLLLTYQMREKFTDIEGDEKKHFLSYIRHLKLNKEEKIIRQTPHWADAINAVKMLTVHAAKGLEFKVVHLPALSDGLFSIRSSGGAGKGSLPAELLKNEISGWEAEEEECLFFVALSRARDNLRLYRAEEYKNISAEESNLLELLAGVLPAAQRAEEHSGKVSTKGLQQTDRRTITYFNEKELRDYIECPLKYQYRHELKVPHFFSESPISKAHLCIVKFWEITNRDKASVDQKFINETFDPIWEKFGPVDHPYAPDYYQEALNMINWTFRNHPPNIEALTRPAWNVQIGNAQVALYPDYVRTVSEKSGTTLIIEKLNFGESPRKQIQEIIYVLYEMAALQNRADSHVKTEVKASFMTNQVTLRVPIPINMQAKGTKDYYDAVEGINAGDFPAQESKKCPLCPYYFICNAKQQ